MATNTPDYLGGTLIWYAAEVTGPVDAVCDALRYALSLLFGK